MLEAGFRAAVRGGALRIVNPADGSLIQELAEDDARAIGQKFVRAREAQQHWAARPLAERIPIVRRFKEEIARRTEELARTLTREMGKPIRQSRNELEALAERLDFFVDKTTPSLASETVLQDEKLTERLTHEPLGVVANVSA